MSFIALIILVGCSDDEGNRIEVESLIEDEYTENGYELYGWSYSKDEISTFATDITRLGVNLAAKDVLWAGQYTIISDSIESNDVIVYFSLGEDANLDSVYTIVESNYTFTCKAKRTIVYANDSTEGAEAIFTETCLKLQQS